MHESTDQRQSGEGGGALQVALNQLWKQLPNADRFEIGQLLAQMIARQILPPGREEGCDD